jgi:hypothetical protein
MGHYIQVEADVHDACTGKRHLCQLFNQKDKPQPSGLSCRFIPAQANSLLSSQGIEGMGKTWDKYEAEICYLLTTICKDIISLDTPDPSTGNDSSIIYHGSEHSKANKKPFHNVDKSLSWMNEMDLATVCITIPEHYGKAPAIASILPALIMKEKLLEDCLSWFPQEAIDQCQEICFDAKNNTLLPPQMTS